MDVRFIAWAGYQFAETGAGGSDLVLAVCPPELTTEDIGGLHIASNVITDINLTGKELKPKLVAYPRPTE